MDLTFLLLLFCKSALNPNNIMLSVSEFAAKSYVQRACASPMHPQSVLTFFFGANFMDNEHVSDMKEGKSLKTMQSIWFSQSDEYDDLCKSFSEAVRAAGKKELLQRKEWNDTVDGIVGQMLLCDQLSRNCFRGTDEAYQYDSVGQELSLKLIEELQKDDTERSVPGEFYPPFIAFALLPMIHSEVIRNHELSLEVLEKVTGQVDPEVKGFFEYQKFSLLEHKDILDRFGRYPHRNAKLGRTNTPEEQAWLDDKEHLPGWAKSQL
eukprot:Nitzschia sp. Nitz4//scaffold126_size65214//7803//8597//NITZ4_006146-RA/size65214-processed-gene-0.85-mRNA-1//-1//CDS//3329534659//6569//frame0